MELKLVSNSRSQLERNTKDLIGKLASVLSTRASRFNGMFSLNITSFASQFQQFKSAFLTSISKIEWTVLLILFLTVNHFVWCFRFFRIFQKFIVSIENGIPWNVQANVWRDLWTKLVRVFGFIHRFGKLLPSGKCRSNGGTG